MHTNQRAIYGVEFLQMYQLTTTQMHPSFNRGPHFHAQQPRENAKPYCEQHHMLAHSDIQKKYVEKISAVH